MGLGFKNSGITATRDARDLFYNVSCQLYASGAPLEAYKRFLVQNEYLTGVLDGGGVSMERCIPTPRPATDDLE